MLSFCTSFNTASSFAPQIRCIGGCWVVPQPYGFPLCFLNYCSYSNLTRILTPSRLYLIDMGNEGRARDSRPPPPHPPGNLFLTGKSDESRQRVSGRQLRGGGWAGRGGACRAGRGREGRKRISYPVTRAYTHKSLLFSYSLLGNEPMSGSHFSSFLHILPLKQYKCRISIKSMKTKIILH